METHAVTVIVQPKYIYTGMFTSVHAIMRQDRMQITHEVPTGKLQPV